MDRRGRFRPPERGQETVKREAFPGWREGRLTLVHAPAGYGKSIWLAQHFSDVEPKATLKAWLTLDEADVEYGRFLHSLSSALSAGGIEPVAFSGNPQADGAVLAQAISTLDRAVLVAVDDYSAAPSEALDGFMRAFVARLGANVHVAIAGRERPRVGAAALALRGELQRIDVETLRFTKAETKALFGDPLEVGALDALHARSEGWPAALMLARREAQGRAHGAVACMNGAVGVIGGFLAEETFDTLPDELKTFLTDTAMLETLDAEACDGVRTTGDSAAVLDALDRSGALVFALAGPVLRWRRHRLLTEFIDARFGRLERPYRERALRRAVELEARKGSLLGAYTMASRFDPDETMLDLIDAKIGARLWEGEGLLRVAERLAARDAAVAGAPRLEGLRGIGLYAAGKYSRALPALEHAQADVAALARGGGPGWEAARRDEHILSALKAALFDDDIVEADADALTQAAANPDANGAREGVGTHLAAVAELNAGESKKALALALSQASDEGAWSRTFGALAGAYCAFAHASPALAARTLAGASFAEGGVEAHLLGPARSCLEVLIARERGMSWRYQPLPPPASLFLLGHTPGLFVQGAYLAAQADLARGEADEALQRLAQARATAHGRGWARASEALHARAATLAVRAGLMDEARALVRTLTESRYARLESALALAHFHLASEAPLAARERLQELLGAAPAPRRLKLEAVVLAARAARALEASHEAHRLVEVFVAACDQGTPVGVFFDAGGGEIMDVVAGLASRSQQLPHAIDTAAALAIARPAFEGGAPLDGPLVEERRLFKALLKTGSRAEAAQALEMSENTLKFYLKRVYQRWGVSDWRLAAKVSEMLEAHASARPQRS